MRILVHICCGPCGIMVLQRLQEQGHDLTGLFFNPNIHPLAEYMKRREGAVRTAERLGVPMILADSLPSREQQWGDAWLPDSGSCEDHAPDELPPAADPVPWLRAVAGREKERCIFCWRMRLRKTATIAACRGFDGFTSSLLYSRYQKHEIFRELGVEIAGSLDLEFVYEDFRVFWQQGIVLSKEWGIYRQQYCGCLFSEYDRYHRDFSRMRGMDAASRPVKGEK